MYGVRIVFDASQPVACHIQIMLMTLKMPAFLIYVVTVCALRDRV